MSKYKKIMLDKGIMQKDLLERVRRTDRRVDKSLLSKIANDICLPTPITLDCICKTLSCDVLDIYDSREINLLQNSSKYAENNAANTVATARKDRGGLSHGDNIYNLTVELDRTIAERIFSKKALRALGYLSKTDFVRQAVYALDKKYQKILEKENAVKGADTLQNG